MEALRLFRIQESSRVEGLLAMISCAGARLWSAMGATRAMQLACLVFALSPAARAGTASARIGVSVTVVPRAIVRTQSLPPELEISTADVKRGYVEVRRATQLMVAKGVRIGFAIDVLPTTPIFSQVAISTRGDETATFGADGGQILGRRRLGSLDPLLLNFRFNLLPGIKPDRYRWPLRLQVCLDY